MTIRVALRHQTKYSYDRRINLGPQVIRLRPAPHSRTRVTSYSLKVSPSQHFLNWQQDPFGNWLARFVFPEQTDHLSLDVDLVAELEVQNPFDFFLEEEAEKLPFDYASDLQSELAPYLKKSAGGPLVDELCGDGPGHPRRRQGGHQAVVARRRRGRRGLLGLLLNCRFF